MQSNQSQCINQLLSNKYAGLGFIHHVPYDTQRLSI